MQVLRQKCVTGKLAHAYKNTQGNRQAKIRCTRVYAGYTHTCTGTRTLTHSVTHVQPHRLMKLKWRLVTMFLNCIKYWRVGSSVGLEAFHNLLLLYAQLPSLIFSAALLDTERDTPAQTHIHTLRHTLSWPLPVCVCFSLMVFQLFFLSFSIHLSKRKKETLNKYCLVVVVETNCCAVSQIRLHSVHLHVQCVHIIHTLCMQSQIQRRYVLIRNDNRNMNVLWLFIQSQGCVDCYIVCST